MYKSFIDPIILHQIAYLEDHEIGFTFSNFEDSSRIAAVEKIMKRAGCFLIKRGEQNVNIHYLN